MDTLHAILNSSLAEDSQLYRPTSKVVKTVNNVLYDQNYSLALMGIWWVYNDCNTKIDGTKPCSLSNNSFTCFYNILRTYKHIKSNKQKVCDIKISVFLFLIFWHLFLNYTRHFAIIYALQIIYFNERHEIKVRGIFILFDVAN